MTPTDNNRKPDPTRRVFDISHPRHRQPSSTSRPLIVGHHPAAADPMVNQRPAAPHHLSPSPVTAPLSEPQSHVDVMSETPAPVAPIVEPRWEVRPDNMPMQPEPTITDETATAELVQPTEASTPTPIHHHLSVHQGHPAPVESSPTTTTTDNKPVEHEHHEAFPLNWLMVSIFIIIAIFVTLYLLVDAGVIRGASHLPFHIFQQNQ